jgi:hypothetical protein
LWLLEIVLAWISNRLLTTAFEELSENPSLVFLKAVYRALFSTSTSRPVTTLDGVFLKPIIRHRSAPVLLLAEKQSLVVFQQADANASPEVFFPSTSSNRVAPFEAASSQTIPLRLFHSFPGQA